MDNSDRLEIHATLTGDEMAIDSLSAASDLSRAQIKHAMQCGAVWLTHNKHTQRIRRGKKQLQGGDELHLYYNPEVLAEQAPAAELIADEGEFSVWYKPYGMRSQGSRWGDHTTIYRWAEQHLLPQRNAFLVHRLDRAASGLILIAHSKRMAARIADLFQQRRVDKRYHVIVSGKPREDSFTIDADLDNKKAISHIKLVEYDPVCFCSLLEVKIETGRKHQIRRHLSGIGLPVVGDRLYGGVTGDKDLQLVAVSLALEISNGQLKQYRLDMDKFPVL